MNRKLSDWEEFLKSKSLEHKTLDEYLSYINTLLTNNVPVIFEIEHLSKFLGIELTELIKIINSPKSFYRCFEIPKRSGGKRKISMPFPTLLFIQKWIKDNILETIQLHSSSHGYVKSKSIITNADLHKHNKIILKMDIADFFPSINIKRVISIFRVCGYSPKVSFYLASLCTLNNQLPQGAATSPLISNVTAKKIDLRLKKLSESFSLVYSRYADDLTFSGEYISPKIILIVEQILSDEGFYINNKKTKLITGNGKKIITGISINSGTLKLPKSKKRLLRQEGYFVTKYPEQYSSKFREEPFYIDQLIGKYNFWMQIEPNNKFVNSTIKRLKYISKNLYKYSI